MTGEKTPLAKLAYFIIGLVVLIVVVQIVGGLVHLLARIVVAGLSIALLVVLGYFVYLLLRSATRNL